MSPFSILPLTSPSTRYQWGYCLKRVDDNVLLMNRYNDKNCIRCFRLLQRSRNVIEVFSEAGVTHTALNRCYTYEWTALDSCSRLNSRSILYRTKEIDGKVTQREYCPFGGFYYFKYRINNNSTISLECNTFSSELNNCPDGSILQLKFKRCNFETRDIKYNCLGSWPRPNNSRYFALWDNNIDNGSPRYKCGLYHVDNKRGKTYMAFSSDSSCTQDLANSTNGYETLILSKNLNQKKKMPEYVKTHVATFPKWAQGLWEESLIVNETMTFTNGSNSYTFTMIESNKETDRHIVYAKDQCEQAFFVCLMMKQRSENVLQFAIGMINNPVSYQHDLCDTPNLDKQQWITQARMEIKRVELGFCPIMGQYIGRIDYRRICVDLSSNCITPEIMYFKLFDCETKLLYIARTYLCLGHWEEKGLIYTYTMENDTATKCFVGLIDDDEKIYINEASGHCIRDIYPPRHIYSNIYIRDIHKVMGIELDKKGRCDYINYEDSPEPIPIKSWF